MKTIFAVIAVFLSVQNLSAMVCVVDLKDSSNQYRESCDGGPEQHITGLSLKTTRVSDLIRRKLDDGFQMPTCIGMGDDTLRCIFSKNEPR